MRNNASFKIASIGTVKIKMFDGVVRTLGDVRPIPDLKRNLISLSTLDAKKYKYIGEGGVVKVSKGALIMMKVQKRSANLYVLQGSMVSGYATVTTSSLLDDDVTRLLHMHLGNMSENGMTELSRIGLLDGQSTSKLKFYEHCVLGKQKRVKFTKGVHSIRGTLNYIHSDLWGPSRVPSKGDANYMLTITDDFSKKVWVFFLKQKSDVFPIFKEWKTMIEK